MKIKKAIAGAIVAAALLGAAQLCNSIGWGVALVCVLATAVFIGVCHALAWAVFTLTEK